jgi:hypothetical protein
MIDSQEKPSMAENATEKPVEEQEQKFAAPTEEAAVEATQPEASEAVEVSEPQAAAEVATPAEEPVSDEAAPQEEEKAEATPTPSAPVAEQEPAAAAASEEPQAEEVPESPSVTPEATTEATSAPEQEEVPAAEPAAVPEEKPEEAPAAEPEPQPEEAEKADSEKKATLVASATPDVATEEEESKLAIPATKAEVIERVKELAANAENASKQELDMLKQAFYKYHKAEMLAAQQQYIENGGDPDKYVPQPDPDEEVYKAEMGVIKEKRTALFLAQEEQKAENLKEKQAIIDRIKELVQQSPEEVNKAFDEFRELQNKWKEIKSVPAESANELWKNYQLYVEQFYDMLKLNSQLREYDFKKNLEAKTHLCEEAEKLSLEKDIISAFRRLQELHQEFREIGPVAKDLREEIWTRFKAASTIINKKHQEHFEALKAKEEENLNKKTAICEKIEAVDFTTLKTYVDWDAKTKEIIEMQTQWKSIGFAPQKMNVKIFERFRASCDAFFQQKAQFFKSLKESQNENLTKKQSLVEQAEALKDSTDWRATTNAFVQLQKEWKSIGAVPRKYSEALWKRFIGACDTFFEAKNKATASQRDEENTNLATKRTIIDKLESIAANAQADAVQTVRDLMDEWNATGHVPFHEKDKLYKKYHDLVDELFKDLNMGYAQRRLNNFKSNIKDRAEKAGNNLTRERERMYRAYEAMKSDLQTYENNLGFLNSSSKSGNSLVNEMKKKMEKLKDDLDLLRKKIQAVDEAIRNGDTELKKPEPKKPEAKAEPKKEETPEAEGPKAEEAPEAEAPKAEETPAAPAEEEAETPAAE